MIHAQPTKYFWAEGGSERSKGEYHWLAGCPWLIVEVSRGGILIESGSPPTDARETFISIPVSELQPMSTLEAALPQPRPETKPSPRGGRWLCAICEQYQPQAQPEPLDFSTQHCANCRCPKEFHEGVFRSMFDRGCGMAWTEVFPPDAPRDEQQVALLHCRCDGFRQMGA